MPYTGGDLPSDFESPGQYYDPNKFSMILPKIEGASYTGVLKEEGVKYDLEKPDYSLVPSQAFEDVVKVLTLGSQKYSRDNWKLLKNARNRYFAAAMRHLWARLRGEITDPESGIDHGAHAICCILFMMQMTNENIDP